jgi:hypothetical protein
VYAPTAVSGAVKTAAGEPVAGALVSVSGTSVEAVTGPDGAFSIAACPMGFRTFTATKEGRPSGSSRVSVNLTTAAVDLVLGQTSGSPRARGRDTQVTLSGRMLYLDKDGVERPMRSVRVILQDDATICWDDLQEGSTDQEGNYNFTYDYHEVWDASGYADVRVIAHAEDGNEEICAVYNDIMNPYPYTLAGECWNDNTSSRRWYDYTKTDEHDRVVWFILECIQDAHERWQQLTGFSTAQIWVDYPVDLGGSSASARFVVAKQYKCIQARDDLPGSLWKPSVYYHEYGHVTHHSAYWCSWELNAYAAYSGSFLFSTFWAGDKWYTEKDNTEAQGETQGGAWKALTEGFAELYAAVIQDWDSGGLQQTLERNVVHRALDDNRVPHSIARALWDAYDSAATPLCCWGVGSDDTQWTTWTKIPRPVGPLGPGDDDRMQPSTPFSSSDVIKWIWQVMDEDWPADIYELRAMVRARHESSLSQLRSLDVSLYANGLCRDLISESVPSLGNVHVEGLRNLDGSYHGVVKVYCEVTDSDVFGGQWDADHIKVCLEGNASESGFTPAPLGYALARAPAPPPGESGDAWYVLQWDTREVSPCESRFADGLYGFCWNEHRDNDYYLVIAGRKENVELRLRATDDLTWTEPLAVPAFTVDNSNALFAAYAKAPAYTSGTCIRWPEGAGIDGDNPNATYELWYRLPAGGQAWGTIAAISYADPSLPAGARYPVMEIGVDLFGQVFFAVNERGEGGPGSGTLRTVRSRTVLQPATWYHLAAQHGSWYPGMRLYVNGVMEDSNSYTGGPQPDSGAPSDGAFSLGQLGAWYAGTAMGDYEELRVSSWGRHAYATFPVYTMPFSLPDSSTEILDHLDGATTGTNGGFTFVP